MASKYNSVGRHASRPRGSAIAKRLQEIAVWLDLKPVAVLAWAPAAVCGRVSSVLTPARIETYALQGRSFHGR